MFVWRVLVALALVGLIQGYKPCIDYESVDIDSTWVLSVKKWNVVQNSQCLTCEKDEDWKWMFGRSSKTTICYTAKAKIGGEDFALNYKCSYQHFGTMACDLDTSGLSGDKKVGIKGIKKFAATDNATWIAVTICLYGKEQWWMIVSTKRILPDAEQKKALSALEALGLDTKVTGKEIIKFTSFERMNCKSKL